MKNIPTAPPLPDVPPAQDFSKLGFVYITVLGLANQVVPHTGSWCPLATALNYLVRIAPIVYMVFQAQPASPVGVQPDSSMGCDRLKTTKISDFWVFGSCLEVHLLDHHPLPVNGLIQVCGKTMSAKMSLSLIFVREGSQTN
ncbi:hypothetical protein DSO57_1015448 [Entomophthora muscae]|uniref:Uncharacterized protein n=1 Tax=Entomophthora muscae TaxID=34485 RepID=A0ACC2U300_9FUNG|nr:hypothetical protein DSO57_1015448 [Entomophthora muscae]